MFYNSPGLYKVCIRTGTVGITQGRPFRIDDETFQKLRLADGTTRNFRFIDLAAANALQVDQLMLTAPMMPSGAMGDGV